MHKIVKESLNEFQKGLDPADSLGLGRRKLIKDWLDKMGVEDYNVNEDYTIDVNGNVDLEDKNLTEFPEFIQFGEVNGWFTCRQNKLESLRGCPKRCTIFSCINNNLISLSGAPKLVENWFNCCYNKIQFTYADVRKVSRVEGNIYV